MYIDWVEIMIVGPEKELQTVWESETIISITRKELLFTL